MCVCVSLSLSSSHFYTTTKWHLQFSAPVAVWNHTCAASMVPLSRVKCSALAERFFPRFLASVGWWWCTCNLLVVWPTVFLRHNSAEKSWRYQKAKKKSEMKQLGFDVGWSFSWSTTVQVEMSTWIKVFFSRMRNESLEESIQLIQFFRGGCGRKFLAFVCWQWLVRGLLTTPKSPGYDTGLSENRYSQSIWIIRIFPINMAKVGDVVYLYTPFFIQPPYFVRHTWGCSSSCKWIYILWSYPLTIIDKHYQYWPWLYSYY